MANNLTDEDFRERWPDFTLREMRCKQTGRCKMLPSFLDRLQALRTDYGKAMIVSSGYRDQSHKKEAHKPRPGTHVIGCAVDIRVRGADALRLIALALKHGFTGIGVSQKGNQRFIHLDDAPATTYRPRPHIWSY